MRFKLLFLIVVQTGYKLIYNRNPAFHHKKTDSQKSFSNILFYETTPYCLALFHKLVAETSGWQNFSAMKKKIEYRTRNRRDWNRI